MDRRLSRKIAAQKELMIPINTHGPIPVAQKTGKTIEVT
jgi:hypothetical protein